MNEKLNFNAAEYQAYLKNHILENDKPGFDTSLAFTDTLKSFYEERGYQPVFVKSFEEEELVKTVLSYLENAGDHGLNPETYHVSLISMEYKNAIKKDPSINNYQHLVNTELLITDAVLKYSYHLRYGVTDPKKVFPTSYFLPSADSASRVLFEPLQQNDLKNYLAQIQPRNPEYRKLMTALKKYELLKSRSWDPIIFTKKKLEPGQSDSSLSAIAHRLIILGFLDSTYSSFSGIYDSVLISSIKNFQSINGLKDDGVIGKITIERLNITPAEYSDKIKIAMERFRWIDYSKDDQYIRVNIPDFRLYVMEKGKALFDIKVCTGKRRSAGYDSQFEIFKRTKNIWHRPDDWETPCMRGEISYMVLNPTWTVPENIIREEIAREMKKDSMYLLRKNFKVLKNGQPVNPQDIKVSDVSASRIPYTIVQDPGAGNALGKIKFMFQNPFGIYLHDTPTRAPFTYVDRAVSHGCVRVEKPMLLSEYLLQNQSNWTLDYLKAEIGLKVDNKESLPEFRRIRSELRRNHSYGKTTELRLDKKVNLYIDYYTVWVDDSGVLNYRDDVYRKDPKLLEALNSVK